MSNLWEDLTKARSNNSLITILWPLKTQGWKPVSRDLGLWAAALSYKISLCFRTGQWWSLGDARKHYQNFLVWGGLLWLLWFLLFVWIFLFVCSFLLFYFSSANKVESIQPGVFIPVFPLQNLFWYFDNKSKGKLQSNPVCLRQDYFQRPSNERIITNWGLFMLQSSHAEFWCK